MYQRIVVYFQLHTFYLPPLMTNPKMATLRHDTTKDGFGPGTFVDTTFRSVPDESRRLLRHLASQTPGFTVDENALSAVKFSGDDLSIIPGPLKSQAIVRSPHHTPW
jgi:hypothetical protein